MAFSTLITQFKEEILVFQWFQSILKFNSEKDWLIDEILKQFLAEFFIALSINYCTLIFSWIVDRKLGVWVENKNSII